MKLLLKGANVFYKGGISKSDISIAGGTIQQIAVDIPTDGFEKVILLNNLVITPGFADVHVHLREPGFSYKETVSSGTTAAARGGYTAVCAMPNLNPPPDSLNNLAIELEIIKHTANVHVYPYGTITKAQKGKELSAMEDMKGDVIAFSDDGVGVQEESMMRQAMEKAAALGKIIAAHAEDNKLLFGGYIHDGAYAQKAGHKGISSASEWSQVKRDLRLVAETGCRYHVCHISTKESVSLVADAKAKGLSVTCETAPHYLLLSEEDLQESGNFKMNPPIRSMKDREALVEGLKNGIIDIIATDHAPHAIKEKSAGLKDSLNGIVGLETAFPTLYTGLVKQGVLSLEKLFFLMCTAPRNIFGIPGGIFEGAPADLSVLDLSANYRIDPNTFCSMGRSTPFEGREVYGETVMTLISGNIVWSRKTRL